MAGILFFWGLGSFLFFKVAFDATFYRDASIIASVLLGLMVSISILGTSFFYAEKMGRTLAKIRLGTKASFFASSISLYISVAILNILVGKAIVFGFSKRLNSEISRSDLLFRGRSYTEEAFTFIAIILIPITFHYITVLWSVNAQAKNLKSAYDE